MFPILAASSNSCSFPIFILFSIPFQSWDTFTPKVPDDVKGEDGASGSAPPINDVLFTKSTQAIIYGRQFKAAQVNSVTLINIENMKTYVLLFLVNAGF